MRRGLALCVLAVWLLACHADTSSEPYSHLTLELTGRPIQFLRHNSTKCNNNGTRRNLTLVRENAITFNFYESANHYTVFQLPRCLFTGEFADNLLNQVDLSKTFQQYASTLNTYATVSQDNIQYKYYGQNLSYQNNLKEQASTVPPPENLRLQTTTSYGKPTTVNASKIHAPAFNGTCYLFKDHELLFTTRESCLYQSFYVTEHDYMTITLTEYFVVLTVVIRETPLLLIFGDTKRIMFKAPYRRENFILKQTKHHQLIVLVKKDHIHYHTYIKSTDFADSLLSTNYMDLDVLLSVWNRHAVNVLQNGQCRSTTKATVETALGYGILLYIASTSPTTPTSIALAIDQQSSILLAEDFISSCMSKIQPRTTLLMYPNAVQLANSTLRTTGHISSVLTISRLIYILVKQHHQDLVSKHDMEQIRNLILLLHKTHISSFLSRFARQELYLASGIIHSMLHHATERRAIFAFETGLCSLAELSHWSQLIGSEEHNHVSDLYSPCAGSGRRDHALEHLQKMFPRATNSRTIKTALSVLETLRPQTLATFPEISCVSTTKSFAAFTVSHATTYLVSTEYIAKGTSFPVLTTVVGRSIIITYIPANSTCSPSSSKHDTLPIVMIRNITLEHCEFCQSTLVEYDDSEGIVNAMYIYDTDDLLFALNYDNHVIAKSPKTHYLMFLKNGTVFEVTEAVVDQTDTHIVLIVIYILAAIVGLYLLYRIVKLM
ncbi:glycoprotein UL75 [Cynomolgus macaque cytomegalovirus strain Ottawa]|uniref:Glycoprotein UL75 n=1 Tax=macacine betaherpesvirus 8 TaxID=2560567 RepID=G8H1B0_9BETA|nr:glycoprotein UL75 [Cynomolgus macaque cytomegalovirus strain Ottawa]AEQ32184.1 glycoprotein UL75 [Cynomolgus macaque cytomegalovirus strain Ottawa]